MSVLSREEGRLTQGVASAFLHFHTPARGVLLGQAWHVQGTERMWEGTEKAGGTCFAVGEGRQFDCGVQLRAGGGSGT